MKKAIRIFDCCLAFLLSIVFTFVGVGQQILPDTINSVDSAETVFEGVYYLHTEQGKSNKVDKPVNKAITDQTAQIKLFGLVPVMNTKISNSKRQYVVPGGENFGVKLYTNGVIVVGMSPVQTAQGSENPGEIAGLKVGDIITQINGETVSNSEQVHESFRNCNGTPVSLKVKRDDSYLNITLNLAVSTTDNEYKAGLWIRDSTAGVGTITFYNTENGVFGGLGHAINDVDTNKIMPLLSGEAVKSSVSAIAKGKQGETGSLCCVFLQDTIGKLITNTEDGIYGTYTIDVAGKEKVPVALRQEVQKGPAQIITTIDGETQSVFSIEIERINYNSETLTKNMVIRVTDPVLIEKTGGIVQGMSGSPIIQNGMLVGAVTHVFVNNPEKGYAIFAENMVETSNKLDS